MQASHEAGLL